MRHWLTHINSVHIERKEEMSRLSDSLRKEDFRAVAEVISVLLNSGAVTATKYISDKLTIRASLKLCKKKFPPINCGSLDIVLTIGSPNYEARQFIRDCKKAKESFPVKKIQLKFLPRKKK